MRHVANSSNRSGRRISTPGEMESDAGLTAEEEIVRIMKGALDQLQQEITTTFTRLKDLDQKLGFLLDVDHLLKYDITADALNILRQQCIVL